jgi:hypothetical protein
MIGRRGFSVLFLVLGFWLSALPVRAEVAVHLFWQQGCPFCALATQELTRIADEDPELTLNRIEVGGVEENDALFLSVVEHFGIDSPGVPLVVIGGRYEIGYAGNRTLDQYTTMISACRDAPCVDVIAELRAGAELAPSETQPEDITGIVTLPLVGEVDLSVLSLPVLTVVLAAVDGFNPCAMWVLALLIGLLLGVADHRRMWLLGAVFLLATAAMYFAVMAAWLNVVLWIGAVAWIRVAIGGLAIAAGGYYLREYWTNPEGVCRITPSTRRKTISEAFQSMIEQPSLLVAALGVAALAVGVNLVELVCSAGIPAIYTQALAMHDLPGPSYYGYLMLYLSVFLLDDTVLFVVAMVTLRRAVATGRYARLSHLIGGVVLLSLGAVMVLRPDLLG